MFDVLLIRVILYNEFGKAVVRFWQNTLGVSAGDKTLPRRAFEAIEYLYKIILLTYVDLVKAINYDSNWLANGVKGFPESL